MRSWKDMEKKIKEQAKHAEEYWGFECLKNGTNLVWDIGEEVYFAIKGIVRKGVVCSVNPSGMCGIKLIPYKEDIVFYIHFTKIYTNVHYALKEAEYQMKEWKHQKK